jgi:hypothetical protein
MIFAELDYPQHYSDVHDELLAFVRRHFSQVQAGHQGDSWIWILDDGEQVAIDTFTSMRHQIKSGRPGAHVRKVIDVLRGQFVVSVYPEPVLEADDDEPEPTDA